jgi:lysozyme
MTPRAKRLAAATALATAIAVPAEGLRQWAYYDPPGILTVCYGTTGPEVVKGKFYSLEQCKAYLNRDMMKAIEHVERCHPGLPENVLAAFGDAVYNLGPTVACNSTASKYLSAGNIPAACNQLPRWNKAKVADVYVELPGLTKRRLKEKELCLS